ncbi:hypothetical protein E6H23_01080 [Candidatus Bathyarchaeota archaeon]|nr:MAG: hypothetical protein E6H23_01080 [Candidatus Bathyarchaeota archaeon]
MPKFMQSLEGPVYERLEKIAKDRGISIQVLIRAVIVPEWFRENGNSLNSENVQHKTTLHRSFGPVSRS